GKPEREVLRIEAELLPATAQTDEPPPAVRPGPPVLKLATQMKSASAAVGRRDAALGTVQECELAVGDHVPAPPERDPELCTSGEAAFPRVVGVDLAPLEQASERDGVPASHAEHRRHGRWGVVPTRCARKRESCKDVDECHGPP